MRAHVRGEASVELEDDNTSVAEHVAVVQDHALVVLDEQPKKQGASAKYDENLGQELSKSPAKRPQPPSLPLLGDASRMFMILQFQNHKYSWFTFKDL